MTTRSALDQYQKEVRDGILRLGSLVNQAVERALEAFRTSDPALAREAIEGDDAIDSLHHKLEETIISTIALQQPMAHDLRQLIAALLITNELERMGDYAEGIGRTALRRGDVAAIEIPPLITDMLSLVTRMISTVMTAYRDESIEQARATAALDDELDHSYKELFDIIVTRMGKGELPVDHGTYLLWAGHNLERIGDRVTNISERIVYAKTGDLGGLNPKTIHDAEDEG